jgi:chromosome partitioning protein
MPRVSVSKEKSASYAELPLAIDLRWHQRGAVNHITICLINQKGGCGKSSTCFHLAGSFAAAGQRVLLIDADPQGSLSQGFLGSDLVENLPAIETLAALFDEDGFFLDRQRLIRPTGFERISLVPTNQHLASYNSPNPEDGAMMQYSLREFLEEQTEYDIVLIDCPPNLYQCSWNAMIAADYVVIPVPPEDFGTQGLRAVHQAIDNARKLNPELRRLGHLVTRYDRRLLVHRSYEERLRQLYKEMVLDTIIPEASAFKVALACRQPVEQYSAKTPAATAMRNLVDELINRIAGKVKRRSIA